MKTKVLKNIISKASASLDEIAKAGKVIKTCWSSQRDEFICMRETEGMEKSDSE